MYAVAPVIKLQLPLKGTGTCIWISTMVVSCYLFCQQPEEQHQKEYGYEEWLSGHTIPFQIQFTCISTTQKTNCLPCPTAECIFSTSNLIFDLPGVLNIFSQIKVTSFKHGVISS